MHTITVGLNGHDLMIKDFYSFSDAIAFIESIDVRNLREWGLETAQLFGKLLVNSTSGNGWKIAITGISVNDNDCNDINEFFKMEVEIK